MADKQGIKKLGTTYLILGALSFPLAVIGAISGSYNLKGPLDVFMDVLMRILFIATPVSLLVSAMGLFKFKGWGRICASAVSVILSVECLIFGILGLGYKGNTVFCTVYFILTLLFLTATIYLFNAKKQFT